LEKGLYIRKKLGHTVNNMADTKVVILAAGKGKRMGASVPKPLVVVAGKPMTAHLLDRIEAAGIDDKPVIVVSEEGKPSFEAELGDRVEYVIQREQNGTGDALRAAEKACKGAKHVIALYGDHPFIGADVLRGLVKLLNENDDAVAMLTAKIPNFEGDYSMFLKWGRILRNEKGGVVAIREAKDCSEEELLTTEVNPGIYAFPADWAFDRLKQVKNENASGEYYIVDLIAIAMNEGKKIVTAPVEPLEVVGINTPEELKKAEELFNKVV
jgi:bifunctional UDP-N-acetylglucosamine pyrophosphorylase/glucosamine-1-phosphate N-acetyltransferase